MSVPVQLIPLRDFPLVSPGDCLADLLRDSLRANGLELQDGDVLVLAQKIVSKAEGRYVALGTVSPSERAGALAAASGKDPRLVELILRESKEVLRVKPGVIIVEHRLGYVHANAGIDRSNIDDSDSDDPRVLLLPEDPDRSAAQIRDALRGGGAIAVIINDSAGRAWRNGIAGFALGCAGLQAVRNQIGQPDLFGRPLEATETAIADELAAAASLAMGQAAEGCPVVLARGARWEPAPEDGDDGARSLIRDRAEDLFR